VLLTGELPAGELPSLYRQATAHLLLSSYEGFGMTITEAFACGCPVLALARSCIPEIAGDAALLLTEAEPDAVAAAMERLSREADLRERLRRAGLARAARFTWERCAAETVAVYRRLLASSGPR
jgi:glycosyltransferase involved in cell wall biosynthesis